MPRPEEPASLVSETVVATCRKGGCGWSSDDEDLALIEAVAHNQSTRHGVRVVTTRTELLRARP